MRILSSTEKGVLVMSVIFIIVGIASLFYPLEGYLHHPSDTGGLLPPTNTAEHFTKSKSRIYGGVAILFGIGLGWLVLYRPKP
jgi:hypothetical protein